MISVGITDDTLSVDLEDGRTISVPIGWYPRLAHGTSEERANFEISGAGRGIHWPDLDEDIDVEGLLIVSPDLDPVLGFEIVKNGRLLYQQDPELWMQERSRLWHAYNDSLPSRRAAFQREKQWIKDNPYPPR